MAQVALPAKAVRQRSPGASSERMDTHVPQCPHRQKFNEFPRRILRNSNEICVTLISGACLRSRIKVPVHREKEPVT